ncbi:MAG: EamA family transporter [Candidatus Gastranaerophilaceae bacterium]|jgi:drug/metabolite transporter (DMT)-like permease
MDTNRVKFVLGVLLVLFLWSLAYPAMIVALGSFHPESLALLRFLIASAVLAVFAYIKKIRLPDKNDFLVIFLCALFGIAISQLMLLNGQKFTDAGTASLLMNTYPVFVAVFSSLMFREFISSTKWLGILVSFCGILIVSFGRNGAFCINQGTFLLLCCAIIVGLYDLEQKELMKKYKPHELTCYFVWIGTFILLIFSNVLVKDIVYATPDAIFSTVYLGIFSSVIASLLWATLLRQTSASSLSNCSYLTPFLSMLLAFVTLHQSPSIYALIGGIVVVTGVTLMSFSRKIRLVILLQKKNLVRVYNRVYSKY